MIQGIFTRQGGVSPKPWDSLNVGGTVGDHPERVLENRRRTLQVFDRSPESVYEVWQVHGHHVVRALGPRQTNRPHNRADGILTDRPDVTLLMRFADCVPILLHDPRHRVVGLVHAGWKGTARKVVQAAVQAMGSTYHSRPEDIQAAIGPSIGPDHYPVGEEVIAAVERAFGHHAYHLLPSLDGGVAFDLWGANRLLLESSGVQRIEMAGLCTACHLEDWFSHRQEAGNTGRFAAVIALRN